MPYSESYLSIQTLLGLAGIVLGVAYVLLLRQPRFLAKAPKFVSDDLPVVCRLGVRAI
jgi:hypothetical protein